MAYPVLSGSPDNSSRLRVDLELVGEEPKYAAPRVFGAGLVVTETGDVEQRRERAIVASPSLGLDAS